ncbi:tubulin monoglycylase TTLL3 [Brachyhypopomus gauderio]|uniref:tubulin monoglycylase TTLL3 n=1 Tax=Brachyhypopomus gauderio TaxID=698409 RepID=UPI0040435979
MKVDVDVKSDQQQHIPVPPLEARIRCSRVTLPVINVDRLRTAKLLVDRAVKERKVFSLQGPYPVVRAALRARGWVERRLLHNPRRGRCHGDQQAEGMEETDSSDDDDDKVQDGDRDDSADEAYDLMSRMVRNETTHFYWTTRRDSVDYLSLQKDQMTNHYARTGCFTTKVGLCTSLRNLQWFDSTDPQMFFPRCYRLGAEDEKHAFTEDFRLTACTSLLQYVTETAGGVWEVGGATELDEAKQAQGFVKQHKLQASQRVGAGLIDTALHVCQEYLNSLEHCDIDVALETPPALSVQEWDDFIRNYYLVIHDGVTLDRCTEYAECCRSMLVQMQKVCPQLETDGLCNIWIIKPGAKSRGRDIVCMNRLDKMLNLVGRDTSLIKDNKWVVQKYLERPLLVEGTKFDLRQWFLVTDWNPLTVWFYRECYLRFSTQPYSTQRLDSSVHLCNNSIQKHFQPSASRDPSLPAENMWSCTEFRSWLASAGRAGLWEEAVVPGMREAVVRTLLTAQDGVEPRRASFELYGADFILGRDLRPWLLEINASPTMATSTAVTARLCPAVQEDTLRVVLDRRYDRDAHTGGFELIYRQAPVDVPQYLGVNLLVEGAPLRRPRAPPCKTFLQSRYELLRKAKPALPTAERTSGQENRLDQAKKVTPPPKLTVEPTLTFQPMLEKRHRLAAPSSSCPLPKLSERSPLHASRVRLRVRGEQAVAATHARRANVLSITRLSPSLDIISLRPRPANQSTHPSSRSTQTAHVSCPILRMHRYLSLVHQHHVDNYRDEEPQKS